MKVEAIQTGGESTHTAYASHICSVAIIGKELVSMQLCPAVINVCCDDPGKLINSFDPMQALVDP